MGCETLPKYIPSVRTRFVRKAEQDARLRSKAGERDARLSIEACIRGAVAQETGEWQAVKVENFFLILLKRPLCKYMQWLEFQASSFTDLLENSDKNFLSLRIESLKCLPC